MRRPDIGRAAPVFLLALAACASLPAIPRPSILPPVEAEIEDRAWRSTGPDGGEIRVFASDGTMLTARCGGGWALTPWRRIDAGRLVWDSEAGPVAAEIAAVGPRELALLVEPDGMATTLVFTRPDTPVAC